MNATKHVVQTYIEFFEHLTPKDLQRLEIIFSADIHFKDPFNDVQGLDNLKRIFSHMFEQCVDPSFEVTDACRCGDRAYLRWDFHCKLKGRGEVYRLQGLSLVRFDTQGRVYEHIDYWDPAEQIYSRLPVLGWLLGLVRKKLSAPTKQPSGGSV
jgi:steroid delta-isomerase